MYVSKEVSSFEFREDATKGPRIELVFSEGLIHALCAPTDTSGVERFVGDFG
jgi:hypothetical protein